MPHRPSYDELTVHLVDSSTPYHDPVSRVRWEWLRLDEYWLPPDAMSLHGLPEFMRLPEPQRIRLSQFEFLNFLEAGLWLEGMFMERIARSLAHRRQDRAALRYRLHELREEAGHSLMFLELMARSGLSIPARCRRPVPLAQAFGRYAPLESLAFWLAVLIGEEIPDRLNRYIRRHAERVCPVVVDMSTAHMIDEARHINYARQLIEQRLRGMGTWRKAGVRIVIERLLRQFVNVFYYPAAPVYELAGLYPGGRWLRAARNNERHVAFVESCVSPTLQLLRDRGLDVRWRRSA
jgi:hypothetical protein